MQQTEKYALNLIETSDPFSPAALNENAQKTEAALLTKADAAEAAAEAAARAAGDAALNSRVTQLEIHKIVVGSYTGTGLGQNVMVGGTPVAVIVHNSKADSVVGTSIALPAVPSVQGSGGTLVKIIPGGFHPWGYADYQNDKYNYVAIM